MDSKCPNLQKINFVSKYYMQFSTCYTDHFDITLDYHYSKLSLFKMKDDSKKSSPCFSDFPRTEIQRYSKDKLGCFHVSRCVRNNRTIQVIFNDFSNF